MSTQLPHPAPTIGPDTAEFWAGTTEGALLLERCPDCQTVIWYPRGGFCPNCGGFSAVRFRAAGTGTVYSFTVVHRGLGEYAGATPFVIAYVELDEGPRLMTNIVDCDPSEVHIGMPVRAVFHDTGAGSALYRFAPTSTPRSGADADSAERTDAQHAL
ncbi:MAG: Zn-ribbon domain-containing OB-fold protein [Acidimicrobiaceae bacterium]|nr:Zn-ribbon domain-containing OB-fold protein [Acidimicrobiaceae bacterium]MBO0747431.1 Zn-ribbon domain-containing OB-fold protein [Acidimicrobiaceae bacterium]